MAGFIFSNLVDELGAAHNAAHPHQLAAGSFGDLLEGLALLRELSELALIVEPIDSPVGLQKRLNVLLRVAVKAAALTDSPTDDDLVALLGKELAPELVDAAAYIIRRVKAGQASAPVGAANPT